MFSPCCDGKRFFLIQSIFYLKIDIHLSSRIEQEQLLKSVMILPVELTTRCCKTGRTNKEERYELKFLKPEESSTGLQFLLLIK